MEHVTSTSTLSSSVNRQDNPSKDLIAKEKKLMQEFKVCLAASLIFMCVCDVEYTTIVVKLWVVLGIFSFLFSHKKRKEGLLNVQEVQLLPSDLFLFFLMSSSVC